MGIQKQLGGGSWKVPIIGGGVTQYSRLIGVTIKSRISITFTYTLIVKIGLESANIETWPRKYNPLYLVIMNVASVLNFVVVVLSVFKLI